MKEIGSLCHVICLKLLSFGLLLLFGVKGREIGVESASDFLK
jgi:hypothetical protein